MVGEWLRTREVPDVSAGFQCAPISGRAGVAHSRASLALRRRPSPSRLCGRARGCGRGSPSRPGAGSLPTQVVAWPSSWPGNTPPRAGRNTWTRRAASTTSSSSWSMLSIGASLCATCPYIYVDKDTSMARGWIQGWPKKFGEVHTTRAFPLKSHAAPRAEAGGRFGGTLAANGRRLAEAVVELESCV